MKKLLTILVLTITTSISAQSLIVKQIGEFTEVKVFDLINVTMIKSYKNEVVIDGSNRRNVQVINKNGKLKIRMEFEESYDGNDTSVILYYTTVDIIDVNEGAEISVKDTLSQFDIKLKAQEGGKITAKIKATYIDVRAVTGGMINLKGTSKNQDVTVYTGGEYNGEELITKTTNISINAAGVAKVNATDYVVARVKAGGDVYIYGNPNKIDKKTVLGGRVKRM